MLFSKSEAENYYADVYNEDETGGEERKGSLTHEMIAAAAGFAAMQAFQKEREEGGGRVKHKKIKSMLASLAAAKVEKIAETKGLGWLDRQRAKRDAKEQAYHLLKEEGEEFDDEEDDEPEYGETEGGYSRPHSAGAGHEEQYAADREESKFRPQSASRPAADYPPNYEQQYVL